MSEIEFSLDEQGIATLTLNRPDRLNALSVQLLVEMRSALEELGSTDAVKALIVTGKGRGFCAGADLTGVGQGPGSGKSPGESVSDTMRDYFNPVMRLLYDFPRPVVTAINGIAAGGGAALALCADIVLASNKAALKVVQVQQLGIVADLGANWLLPRISGRVRALGACLLGDTIPVATLIEWGLVWECADENELLQRAQDVAGRLAAVPAQTVVATRTLVDSASEVTFARMLDDERARQRELCDAPVFAESVREFLGK